MKLLTAQVGWASTSRRIFWTTTAGHEWKDITPKAKAQRVIASVFFLDASNGWALLAYGGKENRETGVSETLFELAFTDNAGESWSTKPLAVRDPDPGRGLSGDAWIDLVDAQHGWLMIRMNGNTAVSLGVLQATEDGGRTWKPLGVPAAGPIRFVTPPDGWLEGGANGGSAPGIYVTRDGGKNWIPVTLKAPPAVGTKIYPTYHLPDFADRDSGSVLVTFSEPNDESPKLALFKTKDRGRTWTLGSTVEEDGTSWYTTFAGSDWLAVGCPSGKFTLLREARGNLSKSEPVGTKPESLCSRNGGGMSGVSFADRDRGWVLLLGGELLSTSDGGTIWEEITPPGAVRVPAASAHADHLTRENRGSRRVALTTHVGHAFRKCQRASWVRPKGWPDNHRIQTGYAPDKGRTHTGRHSGRARDIGPNAHR